MSSVPRCTLRPPQPLDQPPVGGLAGQTLVGDLPAGTVPDGQLHGDVVGQNVGVVLMGIAEGLGVEVLAEQFDLGVADARRVARVEELRRQVFRQAQAVIDLAKQQGPGVGSNPRIGLTQLDRPVKRGLEEPSLAFTHWVHLPFRALRSFLPSIYATERVCAEKKNSDSVNNAG
jgi:hypothetical protein